MPVWYAVFPLLPIALMIIFSKLVISTVKLDTIAALFLVWVLVILVELIRLRSPKKDLQGRHGDVPVDGKDVRRHCRPDYLR